MDTEKMKQDLGGGNVFEIGEPNTAFAQYFIGQSYLKMLTTERVGVGNVTFEPGCRNNWHISSISPSKCRLKERPMSGLRRFLMRNTGN